MLDGLIGGVLGLGLLGTLGGGGWAIRWLVQRLQGLRRDRATLQTALQTTQTALQTTAQENAELRALIRAALDLEWTAASVVTWEAAAHAALGDE